VGQVVAGQVQQHWTGLMLITQCAVMAVPVHCLLLQVLLTILPVVVGLAHMTLFLEDMVALEVGEVVLVPVVLQD
jgi:hypothetical protein